MIIKLQEIKVREIVEDYEDRDEAGVSGYGGRLDIRPPYQREFVYKEQPALKHFLMDEYTAFSLDSGYQ